MFALRVKESIDISFRVHGLEIPADHGYGLFAAICQQVPILRADRTIRLLTVAGHPDRHGKISLKRSRPGDLSRMRIRVAEENAHHFFKLGGRQLSVGVHEIVLGVPAILPLKPAADLFARMVVIAGYQQPDTFLAAVNRQLRSLGVRSGVAEIPLNKYGQIARKTIKVKGDTKVGYSVKITGLTDEDSLLVQHRGIGGKGHMGGGFFMPYREAR
ncbi:MAG: type I-MYXAN CRISPR-associated protein Cas6/Cmx6 [Oscillatoriaceae cyanobacterium Prado104]|jgi:CRISPR-associated endonuclease/helicase Cas3|nr:type I-MYXAN CRISPR-associated protein Cas6/Cmx6 [Oscillatoriaceae cyanobacterium Prado104]